MTKADDDKRRRAMVLLRSGLRAPLFDEDLRAGNCPQVGRTQIRMGTFGLEQVGEAWLPSAGVSGILSRDSGGPKELGPSRGRCPGIQSSYSYRQAMALPQLH